jgi:hypothetical protein
MNEMLHGPRPYKKKYDPESHTWKTIYYTPKDVRYSADDQCCVLPLAFGIPKARMKNVKTGARR